MISDSAVFPFFSLCSISEATPIQLTVQLAVLMASGVIKRGEEKEEENRQAEHANPGKKYWAIC